MAWSSNDQYKVVADKIVSLDPDLIISVAGDVYIDSIEESKRVATIEDISSQTLLLETGPFTESYTLTLEDRDRVVAMDGTTLILTVPTTADVGFPIGSVVYAYNLAAATFTVAGAEGVTVRNSGTIPQFGQASLRKRAINTWVMQL